jgi:hypothetical protein
MNIPVTTTADADRSPRGLRFALILGFGGVMLVFLLATADAIRLLDAMRVEDKTLREATLERANHLASIRSSILLTHTYLGDFLMDSNQQESKDQLAKIQDAWSRLASDLSTYHSATQDEQLMLNAC